MSGAEKEYMEAGGQQRRKNKSFWRGKNNPNVSSRLQGRITYEPPRLKDLQHQNRVKTRKFFLKKRPQVQTPHAPRNTTSFIMRAKSSGGIAPPTPSTPAVLATPDLSTAASYKEGITEEVNKEWGVDGYGSMNGWIRLRASEDGGKEDSESDSDVEQGVESVQQLEQRLDQDLNRFEIVYPAGESGKLSFSLNGMRLEDQESRIAQLEEENLTLKERIYILEQQLEEMKHKLKQREGGDSLDEMEVCSGDAGYDVQEESVRNSSS